MFEGLIDQVCEQIEAISNSPELVRETANYQFILQLRDALVAAGWDPLLCERVVAEIEVDLAQDFHKDYEEGFARIVNAFSEALISIRYVVAKDFTDVERTLITFARQMNVKFN